MDTEKPQQIPEYKYYVSAHLHRRFYLKHNVSEIAFYLHLQVKPTQLGPIDRANPCLRKSGLALSIAHTE
jgi:hypothetical protein